MRICCLCVQNQELEQDAQAAKAKEAQSRIWELNQCRFTTFCRHNQELEQDALATEQEKAKLQQAADNLAEQLDAILHDKFATGSTGFDADTPIDKTMKFLQGIIMASFSCLMCFNTLFECVGSNLHCA